MQMKAEQLITEGSEAMVISDSSTEGENDSIDALDSIDDQSQCKCNGRMAFSKIDLRAMVYRIFVSKKVQNV